MVDEGIRRTEYSSDNATGKLMAYRNIGTSNLRVSVLSYGNWLTSDDNTAETQQLVTDCVQKCWDRGVNYFDSAETYAFGKAETQLGHALKALNKPRDQIVVSTKLIKVGTSPNDVGLSRKRIIEGTR